MKKIILMLFLLFTTGCYSDSNYTVLKRSVAIEFLYPTKNGVYFVNYNGDIDFLPLGKEFIIASSNESKDYIDKKREEFERRIMYIISEKMINGIPEKGDK